MHRLTTLDLHVAGEPLRVVLSGFPEPMGHTILEKRRSCQQQYDHLRRALMWEPRGHPHMYGCLLVTPTTPSSDFGVLFFHNEGYSTMCGHGIIGVVTALLEARLVQWTEPTTTVKLDTPSGQVVATATIQQHHIQKVSFRNVPSFASALDCVIDLPSVGCLHYDLAFGGAFYGFCRAADCGLELRPEQSRQLVDTAMSLKQAIAARHAITHPHEPDLGFLYGIVWIGPPQQAGVYRRHVCVFADGALDRSPTGTAVSAHLALLHARQQILPYQDVTFESILGTCFTGRIVEQCREGEQSMIIPEVEGRAYITGRHEFLLDPDDPLKEGFLLR
ncbi:MAG: proline racemase [Nitrospirae bacterium]|nr:MAG: proline racemase [Nitrospirota bacterium]